MVATSRPVGRHRSAVSNDPSVPYEHHATVQVHYCAILSQVREDECPLLCRARQQLDEHGDGDSIVAPVQVGLVMQVLTQDIPVGRPPQVAHIPTASKMAAERGLELAHLICYS